REAPAAYFDCDRQSPADSRSMCNAGPGDRIAQELVVVKGEGLAGGELDERSSATCATRVTRTRCRPSERVAGDDHRGGCVQREGRYRESSAWPVIAGGRRVSEERVAHHRKRRGALEIHCASVARRVPGPDRAERVVLQHGRMGSGAEPRLDVHRGATVTA